MRASMAMGKRYHAYGYGSLPAVLVKQFVTIGGRFLPQQRQTGARELFPRPRLALARP